MSTPPQSQRTQSKTESALRLTPTVFSQGWKQLIPKRFCPGIDKYNLFTFVGTGSSYHCALWAADVLKMLGKKTLFTQARTSWDFLAFSRLSQKKEKKTARPSKAIREFHVVLSHRGAKNLTLEVLRELGKKPLLLVSAVGAPSEGFAQVEVSPAEVSSSHTIALAGALGALTEILACCCDPRERKRVFEQRKLLVERMARFLESPKDYPRQVLSLSTGVLYWIGGGPFYPIASELALKAREMGHLASQAYPLEEFLHGPMAGVKPQDKIVLLGPVKHGFFETRTAVLRAQASRCGAEVFSPALGELENGLDLPWQALLQLTWGQGLCLQNALLRGVDPDVNPFIA